MDSDDDRPARRSRGLVARPARGGWATGVAAVCVLAGTLFALSASTSAGVPLRTETADQVALLRRAQEQRAELQARVSALEADNLRRAEQIPNVDSGVEQLRRAADALAPATGFAPVSGPALRVALDDAPRGVQVAPDITPDDLVVHQQDVQAVVNALWRGGAEAMTLMDQRVISTSAVRCVGNTLILQGRVYSPPYVITAIGDVEGMRNALSLSPEVALYRQFVQLVRLGYDEREVGTVTLPAYDGGTLLEYARPLRNASDS